MISLLLVLLCINAAFSTKPTTVCSEDPGDETADPVRGGSLKEHNQVRLDLIGGNLALSDGTKLLGSKNMFKITYDCYLEGLAMMAVAGCPSKPNLDHLPEDVSINYAITRGVEPAEVPANETAYYNEHIKPALAEWLDYINEDTLDVKTTIYDAEAMEPFANMIYKNTTKVGCVPLYCVDRKRLVVGCVYNSKPKLNEPLYDPAKGTDGCTSAPKRCGKTIKNSKCIAAGDPDAALEGLCRAPFR
ncbi:SCP-like protein [Ancylostoma caninum]|uniref:SCP-like protein n=1 Tax=Ancylostoma caninum TaxID=29170 RepID=A0A368GVV0_ANCCA|nr:SCP-like protein [Ancylostoma caninum]